MLERSSAQEICDDDLVEEISTVQQHSADEGSSQRAADPAVFSRTAVSSLRSKYPVPLYFFYVFCCLRVKESNMFPVMMKSSFKGI